MQIAESFFAFMSCKGEFGQTRASRYSINLLESNHVYLAACGIWKKPFTCPQAIRNITDMKTLICLLRNLSGSFTAEKALFRGVWGLDCTLLRAGIRHTAPDYHHHRIMKP